MEERENESRITKEYLTVIKSEFRGRKICVQDISDKTVCRIRDIFEKSKGVSLPNSILRTVDDC